MPAAAVAGVSLSPYRRQPQQQVHWLRRSNASQLPQKVTPELPGNISFFLPPNGAARRSPTTSSSTSYSTPSYPVAHS